MDYILSKAYDMLYSPILTPLNLVENVKLDNYKYVNYSRRNGEILCDMLCEIENEDVLFSYYFDMDDKLTKVIMTKDLQVTVLFDRKKELDIIKNNLKKKAKKSPA